MLTHSATALDRLFQDGLRQIRSSGSIHGYPVRFLRENRFLSCENGSNTFSSMSSLWTCTCMDSITKASHSTPFCGRLGGEPMTTTSGNDLGSPAGNWVFKVTASLHREMAVCNCQLPRRESPEILTPPYVVTILAPTSFFPAHTRFLFDLCIRKLNSAFCCTKC